MIKPYHSSLLLLVLLLSSTSCLYSCLAQQCGSQAGGAVCANNLCCSKYGYCGSTTAYCGTDCQSHCTSTSSSGSGSSSSGTGTGTGVSSIITSSIFSKFLSQNSASGCPSNGFYTYNAFIAAAKAYSGFGTTGSSDVQKRELAAFFANVAHETSSGCYVEEINKATYCSASSSAGCASGKQYYGRGPLQLTWNYNYYAAGKAIGFDGINNPGIVASDATVSFKTALWFWMTQQSPTCHTAMTGGQGFGATIKAINGGVECGSGATATGKSEQQARITLYRSFCSTLGVDPGSNLTC